MAPKTHVSAGGVAAHGAQGARLDGAVASDVAKGKASGGGTAVAVGGELDKGRRQRGGVVGGVGLHRMAWGRCGEGPVWGQGPCSVGQRGMSVDCHGWSKLRKGEDPGRKRLGMRRPTALRTAPLEKPTVWAEPGVTVEARVPVAVAFTPAARLPTRPVVVKSPEARALPDRVLA